MRQPLRSGTALPPPARHRLLLLLLPILAACDVTSAPVEVGAVAIAPVQGPLAVGSTVQLVATVLSTSGSTISGRPVDWSSTNDAVASVSADGLLTAVAPGTATIHATAEGRTGTVSITVEPDPCSASGAAALAPGQTTAGTLGPASCIFPPVNTRAQGYEVELSARALLRVHASSSQFQPLVVITDRQMNIVDWGFQSDGAAFVVSDLPAGRYLAWVIAAPGGPQAGSFEIGAVELQPCGASDAATAIAPGVTLAGELADGDCAFWHGGFADGFRLDVATTTGLRIDLSSAAFDAILVLTDTAMNPLWWDDDSGAGTDARIERRLTTGAYLVWATGFHPDATGAFQLAVAEVDIPLCATVGEIAPGRSVSGTLSTTDCRRDEHWFADPWLLHLEAATTVQIDLTSSEFDTFLILEDALGGFIDLDDDGGSGLNSRLVRALPAGDYRVVASSWAPGATGAYQLAVQAAAGAGNLTLTPAPAGAARAGEPWRKAEKP